MLHIIAWALIGVLTPAPGSHTWTPPSHSAPCRHVSYVFNDLRHHAPRCAAPVERPWKG